MEVAAQRYTPPVAVQPVKPVAKSSAPATSEGNKATNRQSNEDDADSYDESDDGRNKKGPLAHGHLEFQNSRDPGVTTSSDFNHRRKVVSWNGWFDEKHRSEVSGSSLVPENYCNRSGLVSVHLMFAYLFIIDFIEFTVIHSLKLTISCAMAEGGGKARQAITQVPTQRWRPP